jgi:hypothetical protein
MFKIFNIITTIGSTNSSGFSMKKFTHRKMHVFMDLDYIGAIKSAIVAEQILLLIFRILKYLDFTYLLCLSSNPFTVCFLAKTHHFHFHVQ